MGIYANRSARISRDTLRVALTSATLTELGGWLSGVERMPAVGERVQCTEGLAQVTKILGKTGDGSRLLELTLPDRPRHPFFAAASNVLVPPVAAGS
jgi:hypothetical protein